jgi:bifunctional UDP-N-acetylglucosamine pyrophosphorylase/glucosamine-1-phosphate N-acetyltransferase
LSFNTDSIALILAAGKGKRMKSDRPKILHKLDGRYIVDHVMEAAREAGFEKQILVIGHKAEQVREALGDREILFAVQAEQLGTGHAVMVARDHLKGFSGDLVVLCGDMPLVKPETIRRLVEERQRLAAAAVVLTVLLDDPARYGRVVRDEKGLLKAIIEYKDADMETRKIKEVNTGAYCFDWQKLESILGSLDDDNRQREYYLTDSISIFVEQGETVGALAASDPAEGMGINSIEELAHVESLIKTGTR